MKERLERQFGWLCVCCVYLDLVSDHQHHVRSWMWWCVPSVQHWGGRDRRIPGAAGQVVLLNWYTSGPVREPLSKKVKSNQERHSTLTSDFYTHSHKCTWHHAYTYACIYHATHAYKIKIKEKTGRVCKRERECEHTDISGLIDFKACTPTTKIKTKSKTKISSQVRISNRCVCWQFLLLWGCQSFQESLQLIG